MSVLLNPSVVAPRVAPPKKMSIDDPITDEGFTCRHFLADTVGSLAYSADSKRLVTGSDDGTARVWDVRPDQELQLLSRADARQQEIAVRLGLGAGRARLMRMLLTETLLLGTGAGLASLYVARETPIILTRWLAGATPEKLVATLRHDNLFWRKHAQRLLVERGRRDVLPALVKLARDPGVDGIGLNAGAIHALWTLHGLGALRDALLPDDVRTALEGLAERVAVRVG